MSNGKTIAAARLLAARQPPIDSFKKITTTIRKDENTIPGGTNGDTNIIPMGGVKKFVQTLVSSTRPAPYIFYVPTTTTNDGYGYAIVNLVKNENGRWAVGLCCDSENDTPAELYVFENITSGSGEAYGMQVFNAAGELTFDSGHRPLVVGGVVTMNRGSGEFGFEGGTVNIPSALQSKKIAVSCSAWYFGVYRLGPAGGQGNARANQVWFGGIRRHSTSQLKTNFCYSAQTARINPKFLVTTTKNNFTVAIIDTALFN